MARAKVRFTDDAVWIAQRKPETGAWLTEQRLEDAGDLKVQFPLERVWSHWEEYQKLASHDGVTWTDWQDNTYQYTTGTVDSEADSVYWLQVTGSDPLDLVVAARRIVGFVQHSRTGQGVLVEEGMESLTPLAQWQDAIISPSGRGIHHLRTQTVITRDGCGLATEVWLPAAVSPGETFPAILIRTPYGRMNSHFAFLHFVDRGYALVIQDTRGRHDSEGVFSPNIFEKEDGDDTLNWVAEQEWCNERIGMIGSSYGGFVQWAAAASGNPHLHAIISRVTAGTPFYDIPVRGGALLSGMLAWAFMVSEPVTDGSKAQRTDWEEVLQIRPLREIPKRALGYSIPFWEEWLDHPNFDAYWQRADWTQTTGASNIPALIISGWYDDDTIGTSQAWRMVTEEQRPHQRLILGPWKHKFNTAREIHNVTFGTEAVRSDMELLYLRWFDRHLKDMDTGVDGEAKVQYFSVGDNTWREASSWPPPETDCRPMYLYSDGTAHDRSGRLEPQAPRTDQRRDVYVYDPADPAPHMIDMSENELHVPENYRQMEARSDVLLYTSEAMTTDMVLAGDVEATLYAATDCPDTDWVVRLTDVDPEGNSIRLCDGLIRARYRKSFAEPELLEPNAIVKYVIPLGKIACTIQKGHRIRVQITSGAKNLVFPHPNTAADPNVETEPVCAQQQIFHDADHPSCVILPVIS